VLKINHISVPPIFHSWVYSGNNWETIRDEALQLEREELIKGSNQLNDVGFNSFFRRGWKRFYLKWYDDFHPSAKNIAQKLSN